jgi:hypothetical protein
MACKAREAAEANYAWEVQMARLDEVIAAAVAANAYGGSLLRAGLTK